MDERTNTKQITMAQQTAIEQLIELCKRTINNQPIDANEKEKGYTDAVAHILSIAYDKLSMVESERRKEDFKIGYNQGYLDAKLNHINDADNAAYEHDYLTNND